MDQRINVDTGSNFEKLFGFSRAARVGPWVSVAGCTAASTDGPVGGDDILAQTAECLRRIEDGLTKASATLRDVVRTRFYVTDITPLAGIGALHREFFGDIRPASTILEVRALALPALLVEVEADAVLGQD